MPSNAAVIDDLERIGAIEEARVSGSDEAGAYVATVIGDRFEAEWFDLCEFDYAIRSIDGRDASGFQLRLDVEDDGSEFVFSG